MESRRGAAGRSEQRVDAAFDQQRQIIAGRWIGRSQRTFAVAQLDHGGTGKKRRRDRQSEAAPSERRSSRFGSVGDHAEGRSDGWQKSLALRRQQKTTGQATEERDAKGPLKRPHLLAHRARRDAQLVGRVLK